MDDERLETASLIALGLETRSPDDDAMRSEVDALSEAACALALAGTPLIQPPAELKARILSCISSYATGSEIAAPFGSGPEACVVADVEGRVQWVNYAFTEMCGYRIEELHGKKPGQLLQGPGTDRRVAAAMSDAIRQQTYCSAEIVNYHKNGQPYWAEISISPILGTDKKARGFVALERLIDREVDLQPA